MFLIFAVAIVLFLLFFKKSPSGGPSFSLPSQTVLPQRDADRKEALELIEVKLIEADKTKRLNEAITVISELQGATVSETAKKSVK